ncbi:ribonuclease H-like domain-containing protein, partial [Lentinula raphanica]
PLKVYTDGSCLNNSHPDAKAGSGIYFGNPSHPSNVSAHVTGTQTNNRAKLYAILIVLQKAPLKCSLEIYSDSEYVIRGIAYRAFAESQSNWDCTNGDILCCITAWISARHAPLILHHVKAHTNNQHNDAADSLAKRGA